MADETHPRKALRLANAIDAAKAVGSPSAVDGGRDDVNIDASIG